MEIHLLRHGIADDGKPGSRDADRALTAEGKKKVREVIELARRSGMRPDVILSSPYKRAMETAKIAAEVLRFEEPLAEAPALTPMSGVSEAWDEIRLYRDSNSILVVGHEPLMGTLIEFLCGARVDVKKGSLTRVDVAQTGPRPLGILKWMLTARIAEVVAD